MGNRILFKNTVCVHKTTFKKQQISQEKNTQHETEQHQSREGIEESILCLNLI